MIWQLLQVRQLNVPLVLVGPMWRNLVDWARTEMLKPEFKLAGPADFDIPICVDTADEAVEVIRRHHQTWLTRAGRP